MRGQKKIKLLLAIYEKFMDDTFSYKERRKRGDISPLTFHNNNSSKSSLDLMFL